MANETMLDQDQGVDGAPEKSKDLMKINEYEVLNKSKLDTLSEKCRIWETKHLLTDADSGTNTKKSCL